MIYEYIRYYINWILHLNILYIEALPRFLWYKVSLDKVYFKLLLYLYNMNSRTFLLYYIWISTTRYHIISEFKYKQWFLVIWIL